jgi:predicted HicB family RNase H-like nuclease
MSPTSALILIAARHVAHVTYTTRQANVILHTNKGNSVEPQKCLEFKFKLRHVNDSSQSKQGIDHLVSQS